MQASVDMCVLMPTLRTVKVTTEFGTFTGEPAIGLAR